MCEFCDQSEVSVMPLDDEEEETECEWISEEHGPGACDSLALYTVTTWYVEDHLCEAHKVETEQMLREGLEEFMESVGFSGAAEFRPIQDEETCDYIDPASSSWTACGKKALYAKYTLDSAVLCAEHAAEMSTAEDDEEGEDDC